MSKKVAKSGYRLVTSWNDDTLYYSRIYIDKNREKIKKNPIKFMSKLLEINWLCYRIACFNYDKVHHNGIWTD